MATNIQTTKDNIKLTVMQNLISTTTVDSRERVTAYTFNTDNKTIMRRRWGGFDYYPMTTWPKNYNPTPAEGRRAKIIDLLEEKLCNSIENPRHSPKELDALMQDLVSLRSVRAKFYSVAPESDDYREMAVTKLMQKYAPTKTGAKAQANPKDQTAARDAAFLTLLSTMASALDGGGMAASISDSLYGITKMLRNKP
jgi:hypothetical protein